MVNGTQLSLLPRSPPDARTHQRQLVGPARARDILADGRHEDLQLFTQRLRRLGALRLLRVPPLGGDDLWLL